MLKRNRMVTVYTLPNCVQCDSTKRIFDRSNISYTTVDLSQDAEAMEKIKAMGYTSAPVVIADDKHWSGFRMDKINNLAKEFDADKAKM